MKEKIVYPPPPSEHYPERTQKQVEWAKAEANRQVEEALTNFALRYRQNCA